MADPRDPGRGGDYLSVSIDVGEHANPVEELKRVYRATSQRLGYRSFSEVKGRDVVELKRMLHALGFWRPELTEFPKEPALRRDLGLMRRDPERFQRETDAQQQALSSFLDEYGAFDLPAVEAVDAFRKAKGLDFQGNPRGLVDDRLVEALRAAYHARQRGAESTGGR